MCATVDGLRYSVRVLARLVADVPVGYLFESRIALSNHTGMGFSRFSHFSNYRDTAH